MVLSFGKTILGMKDRKKAARLYLLLMEKNKNYYEVGDVAFEVVTSEKFEDKEPYTLFSGNPENVKLHYYFSKVDELPEKKGILVSKMDYLEIYRDQNRIYRYLYCFDRKRDYACTCYEEGNDFVEVFVVRAAPKLWGGFIFQAVALEHLLAQYGRIILHASYISVEGNAVLFTAPCGTGKSTQAELWRKYRNAEIINGDRACISCDEIPVAHGLPMSGTSGICKNMSLPLRAIIFLEQGKVNTLERLKGVRAMKAIFSGCWVNTWEKEDVENVLSVIERIVLLIPVYRLSCVPDVTAVEVLEKEIFG